MDDVVNILLVGVGIPVLGLTVIFTTMILRTWWVKSKEMKLKEEQMRLDTRIKQDQANQNIIDSHGKNMHSIEIEAVLKEVRELREELMRTRADFAAQNGLNLTKEPQTQQTSESTRKMQDN